MQLAPPTVIEMNIALFRGCDVLVPWKRHVYPSRCCPVSDGILRESKMSKDLEDFHECKCILQYSWKRGFRPVQKMLP